MNTQKLAFTSFTSIALCLTSLAVAQQRPAQEQQESATATSESAAREAIQLAPADARKAGVRHYAGQDVRSDGGETLGTLKDFIVDAPTGKIAYAVVSSGGLLGAADTLRAIPGEALQRSTAIDGFVVNIDPAQWVQAPAINERDFNAGRINISADQHQQLAELFETNAASTVSSSTTPGGAMRLQRASEIRGKAIRSGPQKVGEIEEVVINLDQGIACALVDPASEFAGTRQKFLVPLQRLNLASTDEIVTTTLARADFEQAQPRAQALASAQVAPEESLSPTGRTSAEQSPQAEAGLIASARAIRQALDQDAALASANVQVTPETGKVMLRGTVRDQDTKMKVEQAAREAASDASIENQITIQNQNR